MEEQIKQIAERIKGLRDIYGLSVQELADELKTSTQTYQDYESGLMDIPVSILYQLAHRYNIELASLLTGEEPRLHTYSLTRNGRGVSVERRKEYQYQNLASNFRHKKTEPFLVTVPPEDGPVHLNSHPGQEFDYVLEGTLQIILDGHEITLNEGDSIYYDSSVGHGMKALDGKPVKFLAVIS